MSQEERTKLREGVPYVKLYRYNQKHLCPKLNGYWDNGQIKLWTSFGSTNDSCQLVTFIFIIPEAVLYFNTSALPHIHFIYQLSCNYKAISHPSNVKAVNRQTNRKMVQKQYTGCHRRNGPNFRRVFLMLNYTDITQNTYVPSWTVIEIMAK